MTRVWRRPERGFDEHLRSRARRDEHAHRTNSFSDTGTANSTRSSKTNWTSQSAPNTLRFAAGSATARTDDDHIAVSAATLLTATVDSTSPVNESTQKGTTSRDQLLRPCRFQTQLRLAKYDGT